MYYRLSALLFLTYAIPGAWIPLFSLRLERELGFTPFQTACAWSSWAIGAIVASLIAGQFADRWLSLERCIAASSAVVGVLLFCLAQATDPLAVWLTAIVVCLFMLPTFTLSVTYALTHLEHPESQFGRVRLWGTIGWVMPAMLLYLWYSQPAWLGPLLDALGRAYSSYADSQRLAGSLSFCLSAYALTLPHTPPLRRGKSWLAPAAALPLLRQRPFAVFALCFFLLQLSVPFSVQQTSLLLAAHGVPQQWLPPLLTIAQWSEMFLLFLLPIISTHLGMRNTLLLGIVAWLTALSIFSIGRPTWLVVGSLALNGFMISCYIVRGQVFIARQAGPDIRSSAQGLVTMLGGIGALLGTILVGWVRELVHKDFTLSFATGAAITFLTALIFFAGFHGAEEPTAKVQTLRWWFWRRQPEVVEAVEGE